MGKFRELRMERYLLCIVLATILGIFSKVFANPFSIFLFFLFFLCLFREKRKYLVLIVIFFILGNLYTGYFFERTNEISYGEKINLQIIVEENKNSNYIAKIVASENNKLLKKRIFFYDSNSLVIGNSYQGTFILEFFKEQRIPYGFHEKMYYFSNNVFYKGKALNLNMAEVQGGLYSVFLKYRENIKENYLNLYTQEAKGLVSAIVFGDKSLFSRDIKNSFQLLGISHLLAVSGLHGGIVAGAAYKLFSPGGFYMKNTSAWFLLALYAFLAGFSPSINRAAFMFFLFSVAKIYLRYPDPWTIISLSAIPQIMLNPFIVLSIGFQLSYLTVIGIFFFKEKDSSPLQISLAAVVASLPLVILYFNKISIVGVFLNLFYIPLFAMITLISMVGLFLPFLSFGGIFDQFLNFIIQGTGRLADLFEFLDISISSPNLWELLLYYFLILCIYQKIKIKKEMLLLVLSILMFFCFFPKNWELTFIDVGQGDSSLITTSKEKVILIDGGPWGGEVDKFLSSKGVNRPELYIVSHGDADHINGLLFLMETKPPKNLLLPINCEINELLEELLILAKEKEVPIIYGYAGQKFYIDDTSFEILAPSMSQKYRDSNNHSLVILVKNMDKKILFTGDIEKEILDDLQVLDDIDLMKAPHHGSNTGLSEKFFNEANIGVTVISCGEHNRYGHPGEEFLELMKKEEIKILRTDENGTISFVNKDKSEFLVKKILD